VSVCVGLEAIFVLCMFVLHFYAIMPLASFCPPHFWFNPLPPNNIYILRVIFWVPRRVVFNPLPLQFKSLLPGQEDCVFFSGHLNLHAKPET
jgi:hypothetical protein